MYQNEKKNILGASNILNHKLHFTVQCLTMQSRVFSVYYIYVWLVLSIWLWLYVNLVSRSDVLVWCGFRHAVNRNQPKIFFPPGWCIPAEQRRAAVLGLVSDPSSHTMASTLPEHCWMERPWDGPGLGAGAGTPSPHQAFLPQAQLLRRRRPGASAASWSEEAPPVTNLRLGRR